MRNDILRYTINIAFSLDNNKNFFMMPSINYNTAYQDRQKPCKTKPPTSMCVRLNIRQAW